MLRSFIASGLVLVTCALAALGCKTTAGRDQASFQVRSADSEGDGDAAQARAQYYKSDRLIEVAITMADWDALANEQPVGGKCNFTYMGETYSTHKVQELKVDGHVFNNVAIKKSSNCGSLSSVKPNLKVSIDKYDPALTSAALAAIGTTNLLLKNSVQDQALVRQCLGAEMIAKAGGPVQLCNFAKVKANGKTIGVYVNLEPNDKTFFSRNFGKPAGNVYEVAGEDLKPEFLSRYKDHLDSFKDPKDKSLADMTALITATVNDRSDDLHDLNKILNIDEFIRFWALEVLLTHWDGLTNDTNNSLIYFDPKDGRAQMLLRGIDQSFTDYDKKDKEDLTVKATEFLYHNHSLTAVLLANPKYRQQLKDTIKDLLDKIWHEEDMLARVDTMTAIVSPLIPDWGANAEPKWSHDRLIRIIKMRKQDVAGFVDKI